MNSIQSIPSVTTSLNSDRRLHSRHYHLYRVFALICALTGLLACVRSAAAETYRVDSVHSSLVFRVRHLNTSNFQGRFNNIAGKLTLDDASPSVELTVKSDSVDTANPGRDDHLKGPDFFNAKQFPEIVFKSTAVKKVDENKYDVEGTLTMHGVTKPLKVQLLRTGSGRGQRGGTIAGFETNFEIKRSEFDMKYGIEGGVGDEVKLSVSLECGKQ